MSQKSRGAGFRVEKKTFITGKVFSTGFRLGVVHHHHPSRPSIRLHRRLYATTQQPPATTPHGHPVSEMWDKYFEKTHHIKYQIVAAPGMEGLAESIVAKWPDRFLYHKTQWKKFPDGTDNIEIGGFQPRNLVLPFYPVGTMERVTQEGQVATANTYAQMFSHLPSCGRPTRLIVYDLHTLQNRFYLHGNAVASLQTSIPLLIQRLKGSPIDCIAFPDDGAAKRFGAMFKGLGYEIVTCGKTRDGDKRVVVIQDGNAKGKHVVIVDDLVQTGGTLYECGVALRSAGALSVNAFVAHGVFPQESWKRFMRQGDRNCFEKFFLTNSIPTITDILPTDDVFEVLPLQDQIVEDLDKYSH
eukprot:scaffold487_cov178-Ochromonas_danica.AAC.36